MDLVNKYWLVDDWSMIEWIFIESNNINYIASDAIVKVLDTCNVRITIFSCVERYLYYINHLI